MKCKCVYNPERDIKAVEPFGYVDLVKANQTSIIDTPIDVSEDDYNNIEDPRSIAGRPSDDFELAQANSVIVGYKAPSSESELASTE